MSLRTKIISYTDGSSAFWLVVTAIVLVALSYVYSVNRTVIFVAERNDIESKITAYRTDISSLESRYISERNGVTLDLAQSLGYGEAKNVTYLQKKAVSVLAQAHKVQ